MVEHPHLTFQKVYTLIAQTPLIHFQPNQVGAALRPSEVKPKLDRYLWKLYGGDVPDAWQISGQPKALNYQMRILSQGGDKRGNLSINDCKAYFGNMGQGAKKDIVFRDCRLEINCFIPDLLKFLDENIGSFFVLHNFGTRQSKGFGGFLVENYSSALYVRESIARCCPHYFYTTVRGTPNAKTMLDHALAIYTVLKNGTNQTRYQNGQYAYPQQYIKGYSLRRFLPATVGSDKAFIKSQVLPSSVRRSKDDLGPYESYVFIRSILGMADHYEFRDDMRNNGFNDRGRLRAKTVNVVHFEGMRVENGELQIPLTAIQNNLGIKRFRSPILIKICGNRIFFILEDSWQLMLNQIFLMMPEQDYKDAGRHLKFGRYAEAQQMFRNARYIRTPPSFDPDAFVDGFIDYFHACKTTMAGFTPHGAGGLMHAASSLTLEKGGQG